MFEEQSKQLFSQLLRIKRISINVGRATTGEIATVALPGTMWNVLVGTGLSNRDLLLLLDRL